MNDDVDLKDRLDRIEKICKSYLETPGFPKNIVLKHVINVAKGEVTQE